MELNKRVFHLQIDFNILTKSIQENWLSEYILYLNLMYDSTYGKIKFKSISSLSKKYKKSRSFLNKWIKRLKELKLINVVNKEITLINYNNLCMNNNVRKNKWLKIYLNKKYLFNLNYIKDYVRCELLKHYIKKQLFFEHVNNVRYSYKKISSIFNISISGTVKIVKKFKLFKWINFNVKEITINKMTVSQFNVYKLTNYYKTERFQGIYYSNTKQALVKKCTYYYI